MIQTIEQRLYEYAVTTIGAPISPDLTATKEVEIQAKQSELMLLKEGVTPRPATKIAYVKLLEDTIDELNTLVQENEQIIITNQNTINQANVDWNVAIQTFIADPSNLKTLPPSLQEQIDTLMMLMGGV
jgi:hypothetical protein